MDILKVLQEELKIGRHQVEAAVKLIDEGNTIPLIVRYQKEATGSLDDEVSRNLDERPKYLRNLEERKEQVVSSVREQKKLTPELERQIQEAATLVTVEDLYRPYRPKRRTRATIAQEKGPAPLADLIALQLCKGPVEEAAEEYIDQEKGMAPVEEAIAGARGIPAERISDQTEYWTYTRRVTMAERTTQSSTKEEDESAYEMYYHYEEALKKTAGHRILAPNRGEAEKVPTVKILASEEQITRYLEKQVVTKDNPYTSPILGDMVEDSYKRLITPVIEREIRNDLTEKAEDGAIKVFGKNLEQLLMQSPTVEQVVFDWDPVFRTGCKLAVVDATGKVPDTVVIYPTAPQNRVEGVKTTLKKLIKKYHITLISVENGTASREPEMITVDLLKEIPEHIRHVTVSEVGAPVYSASKPATEKFPNFNVGQRSMASIARRLQDPLSELVKIDSKSIGVGQYRHDMDQKYLNEVLQGVVEDCVNKVDADSNMALAPLLEYVFGINKALAKSTVAYREENGAFASRKQLLKVVKLRPKACEQCAGFVRIQGGKNPLDGASVYPESYEAAGTLLEKLGYQPSQTAAGGFHGISKKVLDYKKTTAELGIGEITLRDITKELEKPARDLRNEMPKLILRTDVLEMKDLTPGMTLRGTICNIIDLGASVDIGVHQDGLVRISQMTDRYIKHPMEVVSAGDIVEVKVISVDLVKKRVALTTKMQMQKQKQNLIGDADESVDASCQVTRGVLGFEFTIGA